MKQLLLPDAGRRVAIVGGCGGLGRALVSACLELELEPAVLDLPGSIEAYQPPHGVPRFALDVTSQTSVANAFSALATVWDGIDSLAYLAGYAVIPPRPLQDQSTEQFSGVVRTNLEGAFHCAQAALPALRKGRGSSVVLVSSAMAYAPIRGFSSYVAAKAGLGGLNRAMASELAPNIRVNVVAPTAVRTAFIAGGTGRVDDETDTGWFDEAAYVPTVPLGRMATSDDVVGPILFLMSPAAAFMTGQVLHINGGKAMA